MKFENKVLPDEDQLKGFDENPAIGSWIFKRFRNIGGLDILFWRFYLL